MVLGFEGDFAVLLLCGLVCGLSLVPVAQLNVFCIREISYCCIVLIVVTKSPRLFCLGFVNLQIYASTSNLIDNLHDLVVLDNFYSHVDLTDFVDSSSCVMQLIVTSDSDGFGAYQSSNHR